MPSRSSTFLFLIIVVAGAVEEDFKVSLRDRGQQHLVEQNSSAFQFLRVVVGRLFEEAFKVSRKDRVQQRAVEQYFPTFQFLRVVAGEEVSSVYAQTRIQLLHLRALMPWMRLLQGFFALFPKSKKCGFGSALGVETGCGL